MHNIQIIRLENFFSNKDNRCFRNKKNTGEKRWLQKLTKSKKREEEILRENDQKRVSEREGEGRLACSSHLTAIRSKGRPAEEVGYCLREKLWKLRAPMLPPRLHKASSRTAAPLGSSLSSYRNPRPTLERKKKIASNLFFFTRHHLDLYLSARAAGKSAGKNWNARAILARKTGCRNSQCNYTAIPALMWDPHCCGANFLHCTFKNMSICNISLC